jgi:hypothetical protein
MSTSTNDHEQLKQRLRERLDIGLKADDEPEAPEMDDEDDEDDDEPDIEEMAVTKADIVDALVAETDLERDRAEEVVTKALGEEDTRDSAGELKADTDGDETDQKAEISVTRDDLLSSRDGGTEGDVVGQKSGESLTVDDLVSAVEQKAEANEGTSGYESTDDLLSEEVRLK